MTAAFVATGPLAVWVLSQVSVTPAPALAATNNYAGALATIRPAAARPAGGAPANRSELFELVERDPLAFMRLAQNRYQREIRDYRCLLAKQEVVNGAISELEQIEVRCRAAPAAIYMLWQRNADEVKRALYKDDPQFIDKDGNKLARVEPAGAVVRMFVKDLYMPIHGERARKASRRTIDECGFGPSFALWQRFADAASRKGDLDVRYVGQGSVDGRPTFVLERYLPYTGERGVYPDAKLVMHIDQEWLLPVSLESYADKNGRSLLGRYTFSNVQLNPGLTEADFAF